ncbi:hypothetical protein MCOR05_009689 [Pyricularia oryzae]|nr:hypothetical protein MCOR05_009689 [Pyricularia oryzae]
MAVIQPRAVDPAIFCHRTLFNVSGLVAIITGAGSGIGRPIALTMALDGNARFYLLGRRFGKLKQSAASFEPGHAVTRVTTILQVDMPQKNQFVATAARITAETGFVHLFVANAGVLEPKPLGFSGPKVAFIWVGFLIFTICVSMGLIIGQRPE